VKWVDSILWHLPLKLPTFHEPRHFLFPDAPQAVFNIGCPFRAKAPLLSATGFLIRLPLLLWNVMNVMKPSMCMVEAIAHEPRRFPHAARGCGSRYHSRAHISLSLVPVTAYPPPLQGKTPPLFPRGQAASLGVTMVSECMVHGASGHISSHLTASAPALHVRLDFCSSLNNLNLPLVFSRPDYCIASTLKFGRAIRGQNPQALRPQSQSNSDAGYVQ
jgi:hypothetical protein